MRLDEQDKILIAKLKAEREEYRRKAKALKDSELAKKFDCHIRTVERIPIWA